MNVRMSVYPLCVPKPIIRDHHDTLVNCRRANALKDFWRKKFKFPKVDPNTMSVESKHFEMNEND